MQDRGKLKPNQQGKKFNRIHVGYIKSIYPYRFRIYWAGDCVE
jgi:hypothetical protein